MRKLVLFFSLFTILISLPSCVNKQESQLKREVEAVNAECPISMDGMGSMLRLKYDTEAKEVQVYLSLNEDYIDPEALKTHPEMMKQNVKLSFSQGNPREIAEKIMKAGAGLSINYQGATSGKRLKSNCRRKI